MDVPGKVCSAIQNGRLQGVYSAPEHPHDRIRQFHPLLKALEKHFWIGRTVSIAHDVQAIGQDLLACVQQRHAVRPSPGLEPKLPLSTRQLVLNSFVIKV